jgi:hypothetical protein
LAPRRLTIAKPTWLEGRGPARTINSSRPSASWSWAAFGSGAWPHNTSSALPSQHEGLGPEERDCPGWRIGRERRGQDVARAHDDIGRSRVQCAKDGFERPYVALAVREQADTHGGGRLPAFAVQDFSHRLAGLVGARAVGVRLGIDVAERNNGA